MDERQREREREGGSEALNWPDLVSQPVNKQRSRHDPSLVMEGPWNVNGKMHTCTKGPQSLHYSRLQLINTGNKQLNFIISH